MTDVFKAVKISNNVYWVGAIDWSIRNFHGYNTSRGTTYNAYLITAQKPALIDTVKAPFQEEMLSRISSIMNPTDIEIIVSNHSEMDHSGCLPSVIELIKPEKVYASKMGVKTLQQHFGFEDGVLTEAKDGSSLSLGDMELNFLWTRMLHWPDSMFSYLKDEKLLFSQDGFGMHLASTERFAGDIPKDILDYEAAKYYANILMPFSSFVTKLLEKVERMGLEFEIIAPDHGPVWTEDRNRILGHYKKWAQRKAKNKAVVVYDTMWKTTEKMARAVGEGLSQGGTCAKLIPMQQSHRSDVVTELLDSSAIIAGSPTLNRNLLPTMADVLTYIKGLAPKNLIGAAFGAYGWSGEGPGQVKEYLKQTGVEIIEDTISVRYAPCDDDLEKCREMGHNVSLEIADRITEKVQA